MKFPKARFAPLYPWTQTILETGLKLTILLLFCKFLLITISGPPTYGTYFTYQIAGSIEEVIGSVWLVSAIGAIWIQYLYKRNNDRD